MSCKYNNCKHCGYKSECEIYKENAELEEKLNRHKHDCPNCSAFGKHCPHRVNGDPYTYDCYLTVAELEKKISVLLSCKNCPDNKGGLLCQKEYEGKCLSQKTQYIKELKEEIKKWNDEWQEQVQKANDESYARTLQTIQLNKAKELINLFVQWNYGCCEIPDLKDLVKEAEQFLKENK